MLERSDCANRIIEFVQGTKANGLPFFAYIAVPPSKLIAFKRAERRGSYNLQDYGEILEMGDTLIPTPRIVSRLRKRYGINPSLRQDFVNELLDAA